MLLIRLCLEAEVEEGGFRKFSFEGREVLLDKLEGSFHAMDERCTH